MIFWYNDFLKEPVLEGWDTYKLKKVVLIDEGFHYSFSDVSEETVKEFLETEKLSLQEGDSVFPDENTKIFSGSYIFVARAHTIKVMVDGSENILHTQALTVGQALDESIFVIDADDIVKPSRETLIGSGISVVVTRVVIEERVVEKAIPFEKKVNEDETLSWRKNIVTQKGEDGMKKLTYRISKYDDKEVNRKLLDTEIIKEPVPEITTQGTMVKLGKSHTGGASWYAWTGTMAAANPWLPKGSFVKVTNVDNGKSVIVKINDRGPFVPGRIIDLDKVAFAKIASLGAGVINVKMEEIVN
ncbi:MAG: G5 domain-containing protein [Candidatus Moranbacteria bacterium]|nr:G5 domain-containing protein [Candidatus Moranbacteria bacterium]